MKVCPACAEMLQRIYDRWKPEVDAAQTRIDEHYKNDEPVDNYEWVDQDKGLVENVGSILEDIKEILE